MKTTPKPNFKKYPDGLVPVIIQHATTMNVLMLGYMDVEAFTLSRKRNRVTFFSRSKQRLWTKGETSGHFLNIIDFKMDCDRDALLVLVHPSGPTCHRGTNSCFDEFPDQDSERAVASQVRAVTADKIINTVTGGMETQEKLLQQQPEKNRTFTINDLERTIHQRIDDQVAGSYTYSLVQKGINKVAQKVGEEAVETVIEAMDDNDDLFLYESADLLYHYLVLLKAKGFALSDIEKELGKRHQ